MRKSWRVAILAVALVACYLMSRGLLAGPRQSSLSTADVMKEIQKNMTYSAGGFEQEIIVLNHKDGGTWVLRRTSAEIVEHHFPGGYKLMHTSGNHQFTHIESTSDAEFNLGHYNSSGDEFHFKVNQLGNVMIGNDAAAGANASNTLVMKPAPEIPGDTTDMVQIYLRNDILWAKIENGSPIQIAPRVTPTPCP